MKRLQFEMPEERVRELDELAERTGLKTRVQLFNAALTLFEWAVKERENGRIITSMDEVTGKYKELEMPGLPRVASAASVSTFTPSKKTVDEHYATVYAATKQIIQAISKTIIEKEKEIADLSERGEAEMLATVPELDGEELAAISGAVFIEGGIDLEEIPERYRLDQ